MIHDSSVRVLRCMTFESGSSLWSYEWSEQFLRHYLKEKCMFFFFQFFIKYLIYKKIFVLPNPLQGYSKEEKSHLNTEGTERIQQQSKLLEIRDNHMDRDSTLLSIQICRECIQQLSC